MTTVRIPYAFPQDAAALSRQPLPHWLKLAELEDYPARLRNEHFRRAHGDNPGKSSWSVTVTYADGWSREAKRRYVYRTISRFTKVYGVTYSGQSHNGDRFYDVDIKGVALPEYIPFLECDRIRDQAEETEKLDREIEAYQMKEAKTGAAMLDADLEDYMKETKRLKELDREFEAYQVSGVKTGAATLDHMKETKRLKDEQLYVAASFSGYDTCFHLLSRDTITTIVSMAVNRAIKQGKKITTNVQVLRLGEFSTTYILEVDATSDEKDAVEKFMSSLYTAASARARTPKM